MQRNPLEYQLIYIEYILRKKQLNELWDDTPPEIKFLLYGDDGICNLNWDSAVGFLIRPHALLDNMSPSELIASGDTAKVISLLKSIRDGLPL